MKCLSHVIIVNSQKRHLVCLGKDRLVQYIKTGRSVNLRDELYNVSTCEIELMIGSAEEKFSPEGRW